MNNKSQPISKNTQNPATDYSNQHIQNPFYFFYSMPENQILLQQLNFFQINLMPYLQSIQNTTQQTNTSNDKNNIPLLNNLYNIFYALNILQLYNTFNNPGNNQLNYDPNPVAPKPNDTCFLNKKRIDSSLSFEKEKKNICKTEEQHIQNKEAPKLADISNFGSDVTKVISKEENIIKVNETSENENLKKDENGKDIKTQINNNSPKEKQEKKEEKKKGKRKKRISEELLKDTFLEHIGKSIMKCNNMAEEDTSNIKTKPKKTNTNNSKNNKTSKAINTSNENKSINPEVNTIDDISDIKDKDKNKKLKSKNQRNQKRKQHKITIKNNNNILADLRKDDNSEKSVSNHKITKINFHGENYEKTASPIDFMKYNFDFQIEEQYKTKKLIMDYEEQHIDLIKINDNLYENFNYNGQHLDEIAQKWSRKKFDGDNRELKKAIGIIRDSFPGRKVDINEEKCLNILKNNDYKIDDFLNSKHCK